MLSDTQKDWLLILGVGAGLVQAAFAYLALRAPGKEGTADTAEPFLRNPIRVLRSTIRIVDDPTTVSLQRALAFLWLLLGVMNLCLFFAEYVSPRRFSLSQEAMLSWIFLHHTIPAILALMLFVFSPAKRQLAVLYGAISTISICWYVLVYRYSRHWAKFIDPLGYEEARISSFVYHEAEFFALTSVLLTFTTYMVLAGILSFSSLVHLVNESYTRWHNHTTNKSV